MEKFPWFYMGKKCFSLPPSMCDSAEGIKIKCVCVILCLSGPDVYGCSVFKQNVKIRSQRFFMVLTEIANAKNRIRSRFIIASPSSQHPWPLELTHLFTLTLVQRTYTRYHLLGEFKCLNFEKLE